MERFYEASGLGIVDIDDLLDNLRAKMLKDNMPEPLFNVVRLAENVRLKIKQKM